jgi:hypothetical protein
MRKWRPIGATMPSPANAAGRVIRPHAEAVGNGGCANSVRIRVLPVRCGSRALIPADHDLVDHDGFFLDPCGTEDGAMNTGTAGSAGPPAVGHCGRCPRRRPARSGRCSSSGGSGSPASRPPTFPRSMPRSPPSAPPPCRETKRPRHSGQRCQSYGENAIGGSVARLPRASDNRALEGTEFQVQRVDARPC